MLAWTIYISFLGAVVTLSVARRSARTARLLALGAAVAALVCALGGIMQFQPGRVQTITRIAWIPWLGIEYHLAADGISATLVLLTGIAARRCRNWQKRFRCRLDCPRRSWRARRGYCLMWLRR